MADFTPEQLQNASAGRRYGQRKREAQQEAVMSDWYVLDKDHNVVGPVDLIRGAKFFEKQDRVVAKTQVHKECLVSTVFLGLDHRMTGDAGKPPIVFETLVFGGPFDQDGERYCTWEEAVAGHAKYVERCQPIMTEDVPE